MDERQFVETQRAIRSSAENIIRSGDADLVDLLVLPPRLFICSPYRGDVIRNINIARRLCFRACRAGFAPFAPHLIYPQFLDDGHDDDRQRGILSGLAYLKTCKKMWVFIDHGISEGMETEIAAATFYGIPIKEVSFDGSPDNDVPEL